MQTEARCQNGECVLSMKDAAASDEEVEKSGLAFCSTARLRRQVAQPLMDFVPITKWLPRYNIRENLLSDAIGGLTVGIMHIPQGIAYASLAGVRPVNGLYTSLFAPFFYMLFGTSRHISLGVFAVVSLMTGAANVRLSDDYFSTLSLNVSEDIEQEMRLDYGVDVTSTLALLVGIIQIAMAACRLDFLVALLSEQVITSFTVGAAFHVLVAQLDKLTGIPLPRRSGVGKLFMILRDVFEMREKANMITLTASIFTISTLFMFKTFLDPVFKEFTALPIPYDLIVLIIGTSVSCLLNAQDAYHIKVVGPIPTGLPAARLPLLDLFPTLLFDASCISIVILVVSISMAKLFAKKHKYDIDVRQEFYALGALECLSSFFPVWPAATALARTLVYEAAGTKTQLATVFSSIMLLSVILFIGPILEELPVCLLSCIIVVALKGMFMKLAQLPTLFRASKTEAIIFIVCLLATVLFNVIEGLAIGTAASLLIIVFNARRTRLVRLDHEGDGIGDRQKCSIEETDDDDFFEGSLLLLRQNGPLTFLNAANFAPQLQQHVHTTTASRGRKDSTIAHKSLAGDALEKETHVDLDNNAMKELPLTSNARRLHVILDLSVVQYVDYAGAEALLEVILSSHAAGYRGAPPSHVYFGGANDDVMCVIESLPRYKRREHARFFFANVDKAIDAVVNATAVI